MRLSPLQKFILKTCFDTKQSLLRKNALKSYYSGKNLRKDIIEKDITKSIERLIAREFLVGYGKKTAHKWFIHRIMLTPRGRQEAKKLFGRQQKLPLHK